MACEADVVMRTGTRGSPSWPFSDAIYGLGACIFFVGYFLFEVPSNLLLVESRRGAVLEPWCEPVSSPRSSNRTCGFPASGFPTGFIVRPTATTVCARVEGIARPIPRRHAHGRTASCHALALCAVCRGSSSYDHRRDDRRLHTPRQGRHRRSTRTNRPGGGSIAFALRARRPCCPVSTARRPSS